MARGKTTGSARLHSVTLSTRFPPDRRKERVKRRKRVRLKFSIRRQHTARKLAYRWSVVKRTKEVQIRLREKSQLVVILGAHAEHVWIQLLSYVSFSGQTDFLVVILCDGIVFCRSNLKRHKILIDSVIIRFCCRLKRYL